MRKISDMITVAAGFAEKYPTVLVQPSETNMPVSEKPSVGALALASGPIINGRAQAILREVAEFLDMHSRKLKLSALDELKAAQIMEHLKLAERNVIAAKKLLGITSSPKF